MPRKNEIDYLEEIASKTGSATITGPVTVTNEVEIKNDANNPLPVSDNGGSLTVDGSVSVSNFPATQPISGTIGTFANALVNAGTIFSYSTAGNYGLFDAGTDADYVEFRLNGGGGGFTHNIALSVGNSPFILGAGTTLNGGVTVFNDKYPSSHGDSTAYRFLNSNLTSGSSGNYVFSLWSGSTKYRYVRLDVTGGGGGGWAGVFNSYKSSGLTVNNGGDNRILNRVPIAGVVDINSCTSSLPCTVSGTVTVDSLPAISGTVIIDNSVTIASLPAISGTVTANLNDPTNAVIVNQIGDALFGSDQLILALNAGLSLTSNVPISGTVNTSAVQGTTVSNTNFTSETSDTLVSAVSTRKVLTVHNEGPATLFINAGSSVSTTSYQVRLLAGDYWEAPAGQQSLQHSGIFSSAGSAARVTEIS
jgi:hypothetical protein